MKIACTADWHIHEFQDFAKQILVKWNERRQRYVPDPSGKEMNSRLFHILDGICDIRDYCTLHHINNVLHAGDVFHKRGSITVNAFNAAHRVIQTFPDSGIQLTIIAGNHDQVDASNHPDTSIHTLSGSVNVIEQPAITTISDFSELISVLCMPYIRNKSVMMDLFHQLLPQIDLRQSILLVHCGITGGAVGSGMHLLTGDYDLDEFQSNKWKYVVLGHYHRPQLLSDNAFYCGTPVQNSFNDELPDNEHSGYNGFFVVDTSNQFDVDFVPILQPRFITVDSVDKIEEYSSDNYFRVKSIAAPVPDVSDIGDNVRVEVEKDYNVDIRSSIGLADTFEEAAKKYHQENYAGDYEGSLELGLSLLSKARVD